MPDLTCPICGTALMEHELTSCLRRWVRDVTGCWIPLAPAREELQFGYAYRLMEWVWKQTPHVSIRQDLITVRTRADAPITHAELITGPTFPVRAIRAALTVAAWKKEQEAS